MVNTEATITINEMRYILDMASAVTKRKFSNEECSLWHDLLRQYSYDACHEAMKSLLTTYEGFLNPSALVNEIKKIRRTRIAAAMNKIDADIPSGLSGAEYSALMKERMAKAATPPKAPSVPTAHSVESPVRKQISS